MKAFIKCLLILPIFALACNQKINKDPLQTINEFLNSIHSGGSTNLNSYVDGIVAEEVIEIINEIRLNNPNSILKDPNYNISIVSQDEEEAIVNVRDKFNSMNFMLKKRSNSWKIMLKTYGLIDLVRGNFRDSNSQPDEYVAEYGDLGEEQELNSDIVSTQDNPQSYAQSEDNSGSTNEIVDEGTSNNATYQSGSSPSQSTLSQKRKCSDCNGSGKCKTCSKIFRTHYWGGKYSGWKNGSETRPGQVMCTDCRGSGVIYGRKPIGEDPESKECYVSSCNNGWKYCPDCNYSGNGRNLGQCSDCRGTGYRD